MRSRILAAALVLVLPAVLVSADDTKLTVKVEKAEPPKELSDAVRKTLDARALAVSDEKGKLICTVWPAKALDSKATAEQAKAGLKYAHIEETTVVGAVKFAEEWRDYRKQKVKPGVYTMRLAVQLMDGDHMGTAPYNDFALLCPAAEDKAPDLMEVKELYELSTKSTTRKHPAIVLLFPNKAPAEAPAIEAKPKDHVVLSYRVPATAAGQQTHLGFSLVIVGATMAE
jgi:hypothetical protein